jgi:hypothetical protein
MSPAQWALGYTGLLIEVVLVAGLVRRGHARTHPLFVTYIVALMVQPILIAVDFARFYRWELFLLHSILTVTLRYGVTLELAHRLFRGFPGAATSAWNAFLVLVVITSAAVLSFGAGHGDYTEITTVVVPRIAHGTAWILTALCALVLWYRLPLGAIDRAILSGLTPYLLVFTVTMSLLAKRDWAARESLGFANTVAWTLLIVYWARMAWSVRASEGFGRSPGPREAWHGRAA